jgi:hypothetical protein
MAQIVLMVNVNARLLVGTLFAERIPAASLAAVVRVTNPA